MFPCPESALKAVKADLKQKLEGIRKREAGIRRRAERGNRRGRGDSLTGKEQEKAFLFNLRDECPKCGMELLGKDDDRVAHLMECNDTGKHKAYKAKQAKAAAKGSLPLLFFCFLWFARSAAPGAHVRFCGVWGRRFPNVDLCPLHLEVLFFPPPMTSAIAALRKFLGASDLSLRSRRRQLSPPRPFRRALTSFRIQLTKFVVRVQFPKQI